MHIIDPRPSFKSVGCDLVWWMEYSIQYSVITVTLIRPHPMSSHVSFLSGIVSRPFAENQTYYVASRKVYLKYLCSPDIFGHVNANTVEQLTSFLWTTAIGYDKQFEKQRRM